MQINKQDVVAVVLGGPSSEAEISRVTGGAIANALREKGYPFYAEPYTNQLFPILPDEKIRELERDFSFELNARVDETHTAVRFVTSWATTDAQVDALLALLTEVLG